MENKKRQRKNNGKQGEEATDQAGEDLDSQSSQGALQPIQHSHLLPAPQHAFQIIHGGKSRQHAQSGGYSWCLPL